MAKSPSTVAFTKKSSYAKKSGKALRAARRLRRDKIDWITFYREILGVDGVVRQLYPDPPDLYQFEHSEEFEQILTMLRELRDDQTTQPPEDKEAERVITVRLPKSIHKTLLAEANEFGRSMNKLCIAKLIQALDEELPPAGEEIDENDESDETSNRTRYQKTAAKRAQRKG